MDNGRTLGITGNQTVRYMDVVSGSQGMTLMLRITDGKDPTAWTPMLLIQNASRSYPIQNVADNVPGVCYRTGPEGWVDSVVFSEYSNELHVFKKDPQGIKKVLYIDNCSSHGITTEEQEALEPQHGDTQAAAELGAPHIAMRFFIIQKVKTWWRQPRDAHKAKMIETGQVHGCESFRKYRQFRPSLLPEACITVRT
jgi:hypothetical protein